MKLAVAAFVCALALAFVPTAVISGNNLTDDQIRRILIQDSLSSYPGNCPCPYNSDRAGRRCGKRSAYTKPGGYAPLCYSQDVTEEMVERYRRQAQNSR